MFDCFKKKKRITKDYSLNNNNNNNNNNQSIQSINQ